MNKQSFGKQGEDLALEFLKQKGYKILETNFRKRSGEIDLVALSPSSEYVFVEVKTRHGSGFGYPEEAVDQRKLRKMFLTAERWMGMKNLDTDNYRLDVIAIEVANGQNKITHIENVY